jgi:hypothetical protein
MKNNGSFQYLTEQDEFVKEHMENETAFQKALQKVVRRQKKLNCSLVKKLRQLNLFESI